MYAGNIAAEPLVAQGCRGIGGVYEVAESDRYVFLNIDRYVFMKITCKHRV